MKLTGATYSHMYCSCSSKCYLHRCGKDLQFIVVMCAFLHDYYQYINEIKLYSLSVNMPLCTANKNIFSQHALLFCGLRKSLPWNIAFLLVFTLHFSPMFYMADVYQIIPHLNSISGPCVPHNIAYVCSQIPCVGLPNSYCCQLN